MPISSVRFRLDVCPVSYCFDLLITTEHTECTELNLGNSLGDLGGLGG